MDRIKKMVKTGSRNGGVGGDVGDGDSEINSNAGDADHEMNGASDDWSLAGGPPGSRNTRSSGIFGRRGGTRNSASGAVSLSAMSSRGRQSVTKLLAGGQSVVSAIEARSRRSLSRRRRQTSSSPQRRSSSTPRASRSPRPSGSASVSASPRSGSKRDKKKDKKSKRSSDYTLNLDARLRELNAQPAPKGLSDDKSLTARTTGGDYRRRGLHHKSQSNNDVQSRLEALALERTSESPKRDRKSSSGRSSSQTRDSESPRKLRKSRRTKEDAGDSQLSKPSRAASSPAIPDLHGSHSGSIGSTESKKKKKKKRHSASDISPEEMQKLRERRDQLKKEASRKKKKGRKSKTDDDGSQSTITTHDSNDPSSPRKKRDKRRKSKIDTEGFPAVIPEKGDPAGAKGSNSNPFNDVISSALSEDDRGRGKQSEIEAGLSSFDDIWGMESARFDNPDTKDEPKAKKSATDLIAERKAIEKARSFMKINDGTQNEGSSQPATIASTATEEPAPPPSEASLSAAPTSTTTTATTASSHADDDAQQEELLRLQHQLSEALQKVLVMSEEQIEDKDQFLKASSELARVKVELAEAIEERGELIDQVKQRDADLKDCQKRIGKLEQAIERQLDTQDALEVKLEKSEDEIEKLLVEMQEMETKMSNGESVGGGGGGGGGASLVELREAKKAVENKNDEIKKLNTRIEDLEKELKDAMTVPQLQIDELDEENKALQGRLKGEKLEANAKLAAKEEMIKNLQAELDQYKGSSDAQDLVSARTKLNEARADATAVREDLDTAKQMIEEMQNEREDLLEKNSILLDNVKLLEQSVKDLTEKSDMLSGKVLDWTEKTYDWKAKAETLERKLDAYKDEDANSGMVDSEVSDDVEDVAPQGLLLQAAMDKSASNNKKKWGIFGGKQDQNMSVDEIRIKTLQERNDALEESMTEIRSEMVRMQTAHKEELYNAQKKIARLEGENDALSLQNATLSQLANQDDQ